MAMKVPVLDSLAPRPRRLVKWVLGILLFYTLTGFFILPPIIRAVAVKKLSAQLHREVSIQKVKLNPFALSATIRGLLIKDRDGQPFVSWDEVYVNFQLSSLFGHPWVFKEVRTINPYVRVQVNRDRSLNFSDLIAQSATNAPPTKPAKPLALTVDRFHIGGATASLTDLTTSTPFKRTVGPLDVTLVNFHTDPDNKNPYSFSGTTDAGEEFSWSGYFFLGPIRSEGEFTLENLALNKYAPLYQDFVRFKVRNGTVDARATYRVELSASNRVATVTNTSFHLHNFELAEPDNDTDIADLPDFALTDASVDAVARRAEVDSVSASGGKLVLRRNRNSSINVVELARPVAGATNAPGGILLLLQSVTNAVAMILNSTNNWSGTVHEVNVQNCALDLEDLINSRPVRLNLDEIALNAKHISNVPGTDLTATLSLRWNTNGTIRSDVTASFYPPTADVHLNLDKLDLHPLDPYLESRLNVFIIGSKLGLDGRLNLRTPKDQVPEVTFQGDAWLDDFATVDSVLAEDLLKWQSVRINGIDANLNPPAVAIKDVAVKDAYARVIIETNHTINLLTALRMGPTNATGIEEGPPPSGQRDSVSNSLAQTRSESVLPAATTPTAASNSLPRITISSVVISNAEMRFTDRSLTPNVNLAIQQVDGTVSGLSSEELQHADVNLHAKVDNVGPVEITGTINPFTERTTNELKIAVKDVDLTPASPYSAKFAGYRIAKGKLNLDLDYHLAGKALTSKNVITLDQFTFGEKVNSPDATKLPVRLAVAVLKDREGKIVLDVPIEGSLDDPQFRLGKVITRAIVNVITKIVTSPFAVLGAIFGGHGEELSYQNFTAGSAALLPAAREKLDSLIKGLYERPGLQLEIEGSIDPEADREGLKRAFLDRKLRAAKWKSLRKSEQATNTVDQITLSSDERTVWLRRLYDEALSQGDIDLAKLSANTNTAAMAAQLPTRATEPQKGAARMMQNLKPTTPESTSTPTPATQPAPTTITDPIELALLTTITVEDSDLQTLASERAKAVRDYILQSGKVEPERVFLTESQSGVKTQGSRAYLQFR